MPLSDAITLARNQGVDLVEVAAAANPPVCRLVDYGKFRYEQSKKDKEAKKHQHANKVKEIQLSASIDAHDYGVKLSHAVEFACEDMKVKVSLRFRGREMAHTEFGFQVINRFINDLAPFAHPDTNPKLVGRSINLIFTPLPRNKRAKNPNVGAATGAAKPPVEGGEAGPDTGGHAPKPNKPNPQAPRPTGGASGGPSTSGGNFQNNPFNGIELSS